MGNVNDPALDRIFSALRTPSASDLARLRAGEGQVSELIAHSGSVSRRFPSIQGAGGGRSGLARARCAVSPVRLNAARSCRRGELVGRLPRVLGAELDRLELLVKRSSRKEQRCQTQVSRNRARARDSALHRAPAANSVRGLSKPEYIRQWFRTVGWPVTLAKTLRFQGVGLPVCDDGA